MDRPVSAHVCVLPAGPHLVRAAIGEDVTQEELGGSCVHCRRSGVGDVEVADDAECIARIKQYLAFCPSHCEQRPPLLPVSDPVDRMDEELLDVLPETSRTLELAEGKRVERPWKRHGVVPV